MDVLEHESTVEPLSDPRIDTGQMEPVRTLEATLAAIERATTLGDQKGDPRLIEHITHVDPAAVSAISAAAQRLSDAGRFEAAEALLARAAKLSPSVWIARDLGLIAERRGDREAAHRRFQDMLRDFPDHEVTHACYIHSLLNNAADTAAAEIHAEQSVSAFPGYLWVADAFAQCAETRGDWEGALRRWADVRTRHPQHQGAIWGLVRALTRLRRYDELEQVARGEPVDLSPARAIDDLEYRCPTDLMHTPTPLRRILVVGSCLASGLPDILASVTPRCDADFYAFNNASRLPEHPPRPASAYDFQFVQIPLRSILPDGAHLNIAYDDRAAYRKLFDDAHERLKQALSAALKWNRDHGLLSFVCNFLVPQQNPMGRLLPRYDARNFVYVVEKLNEALAAELHAYQNVHLFDFDQIVASQGRRHFQDDVLWVTGHAAGLSDAHYDSDQARLEPLQPAPYYYRPRLQQVMAAAWRELVALYRTVRQVDMVKLVLVDLDDTLWRGVVAETGDISNMTCEGWPVGLVEALQFLKRRGILLGIVSKNDEQRIVELWPAIYGDRLPLNQFAVRRINWRPKAENIEEILANLNLLPGNVVFIDDNPAERAAVKAAFPDMRVLGDNPYLLRRILLWAPETQVATVTPESARRTEMVVAQVARERQRTRLSRGEFLATLELRVSMTEIASIGQPEFARAIELLNKTNQFNTTGRRWTPQECAALFKAGGRFHTMDVRDKFTAYGIVGVVVVHGGDILQFVMSCRVIGLDAEIAALAAVLRRMAETGIKTATARLVETPANLLCRDFFPSAGFIAKGLYLVRDVAPGLPIPAHVDLQPAGRTGCNAAE